MLAAMPAFTSAAHTQHFRGTPGMAKMPSSINASTIAVAAKSPKEAKKFIKKQFIKGNITFGTVTSVGQDSFMVDVHTKDGKKGFMVSSSTEELSVGTHVAIAGKRGENGIDEVSTLKVITHIPSFLEHKGLFKGNNK